VLDNVLMYSVHYTKRRLPILLSGPRTPIAELRRGPDLGLVPESRSPTVRRPLPDGAVYGSLPRRRWLDETTLRAAVTVANPCQGRPSSGPHTSTDLRMVDTLFAASRACPAALESLAEAMRAIALGESA
jgi:hypothetical protein